MTLLVFLGVAPLTAQGTTELDIPYTPLGGHKQQLDLFLPNVDGFPTVLYVHEGSLSGGDRKEEPYAGICRAFVARGVGCAVMSYRLFPSVDWPAPAEDVAAAYAWLRNNIGPRGGDPAQIFLIGHSSGCTLAALVGSDSRYLAAHGLRPRDIAGVVAMGCRLNDPPPDTTGVHPERVERFLREDPWGARFGSLEALRSFRPMAHVGPHMPPFLVLIAEAERFKPPILADAAVFVGAARDCRVDADLHVLLERTHMSAIQGMVDPEDDASRRISAFIHRMAREGPAMHESEPDLCPNRHE